MEKYKACFVNDFSVNIAGNPLPKKAMFGKTASFYWYIDDFASLKNNCAIIYLMRIKGDDHFRPYVMRTDTTLAEIFRKALQEKYGNSWNSVKCVYVLGANKAYKPKFRNPQRTYIPKSNNKYYLSKMNADNCDFGGGGDAVMLDVRKDHMKLKFADYSRKVAEVQIPNPYNVEKDEKTGKHYVTKYGVRIDV